MKKLLLASLAALALASAPAAFARPMTATDLATMRRLGAPAVSPDGRWAVYQLRETDLAANRGRTDLCLLDLRRAGAEPVRIASAPEHNEHDPRFSADGRWLYYLSNASGSDQLWRVALPAGTPERVTDLATDIAGFALAPTRRPDRDLGRPQHGLRRLQLRQRPGRRRRGRARAASTTRPSCATGTPGSSPACARASSPSRWSTAGRRARARRSRRNLVGDSPSKPFGGGEELAWSPDGRTLYFTLREGGPHRAQLDQSRHLRRPRRRQRRADQPHRRQPGHGHRPRPSRPTAAGSPTPRWRAPTYEADRQVVQLRDLRTGETRALTEAWDRSVGSIAWAPDGRSLLRHRRRHARHAGVPRRRRAPAASPG